MDIIKIKDKSFNLFISNEEIKEKIKKLAEKLNKDLINKNPLFLGILNGSFMFAGELFQNLTIDCEISFLKVSSYVGINSIGKIKKLIGFDEDIKDRTIIILEDIVDTGHTINYLEKLLIKKEPREILITTLLYKPDKYEYKNKYDIDYYCFEIPNEFIVGYGLDYDGYGRNIKNIYKIN